MGIVINLKYLGRVLDKTDGDYTELYSNLANTRAR